MTSGSILQNVLQDQTRIHWTVSVQRSHRKQTHPASLVTMDAVVLPRYLGTIRLPIASLSPFLSDSLPAIESHQEPLLSARGAADRRNGAEAVPAHPNMNASPGKPGRWPQVIVKNLRRAQITRAG